MKSIALAAIAALLWVSSLLAQEGAIGTFTYSTDYSATAKGYVAILDIARGGFTPAVTKQETAVCPPGDITGTVYPRAPSVFADYAGTFLTMTANTGNPNPGNCANPDGLLISDGQVVNWPQEPGLVLYFLSPKNAAITDGPLPRASAMRWAVAGSTTQGSNCGRGQLLLKDGKVQNCIVPKPTIAAPRGAIGLDQSGRRLIMLVTDGDEGTGTGLQTRDFARLMLAFGGWNAVNFDGGGSAEFLYFPAAGKPSWCQDCAVAIGRAAIPSDNPQNLRFVSAPALHDLNKMIFFFAQKGEERRVYASIGFRIQK